jgi:hypothetical protein
MTVTTYLPWISKNQRGNGATPVTTIHTIRTSTKGMLQCSGSARKLTSHSKINGAPSANANRQLSAFARMGQRIIHIMTIIITTTPIITLVPIRLLTIIIPTRTLATILTQQVVGNETCPEATSSRTITQKSLLIVLIKMAKQYCFDIRNSSSINFNIEELKGFVEDLYIGPGKYPDNKALPFDVIYVPSDHHVCILMTKKTKTDTAKISEINASFDPDELEWEHGISLDPPVEFGVDLLE